MKRLILTIVFSVLLLNTYHLVWGQDQPSQPTVFPSSKLGMGNMVVIPPCVQYDETFSRKDAVEILANLPEEAKPELKGDVRFDPAIWAKDIRFSRDIWCLEFAFKPVRMIWVDVPVKGGKVEKRLYWYMIYSVTNTGKTMQSVPDKQLAVPEQTEVKVVPCNCPFCQKSGNVQQEQTKPMQIAPVVRNEVGSYKPVFSETPIPFCPQFILASDRVLENATSTVDPKTGDVNTEAKRTTAVFRDQIVPLAYDAIAAREAVGQKLETTVSIANKPIKPNETVWGVAIWENVDPRINSFSVFVSGLTNAYHWVYKKTGDQYDFKKGDPIESGRDLTRKTLKLNFWRPGDEFEQNERQIRYGIPGELDYEWNYH